MRNATHPNPSPHAAPAACAAPPVGARRPPRPHWRRDALADLPIWRCDVATGRPELPALLLAVWLPRRARNWEWEVIDPRSDTSIAEGGSGSHTLARAAAEAWIRRRFGIALERD